MTTTDVKDAAVSRAGLAAPRQARLRTDPKSLLPGLLRGSDIGAACLAGLLVHLVHDASLLVPFRLILVIAFVSLVFADLAHVADAYKLDAARIPVMRVLIVWTIAVAGLISVLYFLKVSDEVPRSWIAGWYALTMALLIAERRAARRWLRRWRRTERYAPNVAILGGDREALSQVERICRSSEGPVKVIGTFALPAVDEAAQKGTAGPGAEELQTLIRMGKVDEVVVAVSLPETALLDNLHAIRNTSVNVNVCLPDLVRIGYRPHGAQSLSGLPFLNVFERPLAGWKGVVKRIEDCVLAAAALVLVAPLMALVTILIRLDSPGPILFRQLRYGFNNNPITVYKFRTMRHDPQAGQYGPQARRHDPRVTSVGYFLRRTSLDELPQLFNVLRGDMSLVGPRPHPIRLNEEYAPIIDDYLARHRVRPGITGLAQVNGYRGETDTLDKMRRRIEYDLKYIDQWSLTLDMSILIRTLFVGFVHPQAY